MTPQERGARGGQATVAKYGRQHMQEIGRLGFTSAVAKGWGPYLASAVFHVELPATYNAAAAQARAQARRAHPELGRCQWPFCEAAATQRHHVDGWAVSDEVTGLCDSHHTTLHQEHRASGRVWRGRHGERPSLRSVSIGLGIGIDPEAVPF